MSAKPLAGLSLDLDNLWSYMRSYGDERWRDYPSFLHVAIPRIIAVLAAFNLSATVFVVGRDAESSTDKGLIRQLVDAGHELGNHSFAHAPGFGRFTPDQLIEDFTRSESALYEIARSRVVGFRAPSFALSENVVTLLGQRGYHYDSSLFPSSIGPLARLWERVNFRRAAAEEDERADVYGGFRAARQPLPPFLWLSSSSAPSAPPSSGLVELPVTTMPYSRAPMHWTYLNFIASKSTRLGLAYLSAHIRLLRAANLTPTLLLHSTDFLGSDDPNVPHFMPGMGMKVDLKLDFLRQTLVRYRQDFDLQPLHRCVTALVQSGTLGTRAVGAHVF